MIKRGAHQHGWSVRLAAHVETWRPYTLAYPSMLALAGIGATCSHDLGWRSATPCLGLSAGWLGAHYLGDLLDRDLDEIAKPHRPIPSGRLSSAAAAISAIACFTLLLSIGLAMNWPMFAAALLIVLGSAGYSARLKGAGMSGSLVRGSLGAVGVLYGAFAVGPLPPWGVLVPALVFWCHDTSSNVVGTIRDVSGDGEGGCQTVAVVRGVRFALVLAGLFYVVATVGATAGLWLLGLTNVAYLVALLVSIILGYYAFSGLHDQDGLQPNQALHSHAILNVERLILTAGFATYALSLFVIVPLLLVSLAAAIGLHYTMRLHHEFGHNHWRKPVGNHKQAGFSLD
jgi:geranylgeranylglycerol-phosphate geranylgeranyltransferase